VSKSGKVYYYNKRTLVNQWKKPEDWLREEERLNNPPLPPQSEPPQQPPQPPPQPPPPEDDEDTGKLKLKLMTMKKLHKRLKNPDANLPRAYQKNQKRLDESDSDTEEGAKPRMTISDAFENPEDDVEQAGQQKLAKLDAEDEIGHLKIPEPVEDENKPSEVISADAIAIQTEQKDARKFNPRISGPERAANLALGCAAQLAFKNISTLPNPGESLQSAGSGNPTYFTEYNLPCTLRRCKFPKEQDVLHELKQNKTKRRTFIQPPSIGDLASGLSHLAQEAQMEQFMSEVKNYNNHDRLMTSRMDNVLVYKIPDDVWERYFYLFQVKLFDGVYLECKPSGYTHNDELIYSRTGKICGHRTFPEDEIRCQAVLQAWNKSACLCMYANRVFRIKRDDEAWKDDLYECKRFLEKHGY